MKPSKELDSYTKDFYSHLQESAAGADPKIGNLIQERSIYCLSKDAEALTFGATWCFNYNGASKSGEVAIYYTEDCRICRPDCLESLANLCELLKAIAGYRSFRFRGSDGHWYVKWNPETTGEHDQWIKGAVIDG